ncbi:hypothetical protein BH10ACT10_BH10ACT10_21070 [soil metagenome]
MSITPLLSLAASDATGGINPWFVGVGVFVLLVALLGGLLAFGGGRDHS